VYVGTGGIACCVAGCAWNVEAPQFGQNARPGLISALQLGQSVFFGASELPQPLQNVSPSSYGVLQFGQRNVPLTVDGTY
jgi:hypothetical protein